MRSHIFVTLIVFSACSKEAATPVPDAPQELTPTPTSTPASTPTLTPEPTPASTPTLTPEPTPLPPKLISSWQDLVGIWHRDLDKNGVITHFTMSMEPSEYPDRPDSAAFYRQRYSEDDGAETISEGYYGVKIPGELSLYNVTAQGEAPQYATWVSTQCYRWENPVRLACAEWGGEAYPFYQTSSTAEPR